MKTCANTTIPPEMELNTKRGHHLLPYRQSPRNMITILVDYLWGKALAPRLNRLCFFQAKLNGKALKFGLHGVSGLLALATTAWALFGCSDESAALTSVLWSFITGASASLLLKRVPQADPVLLPKNKNGPTIVAAHVDAFKVAIAMLFYCNIRCLQSHFAPDWLWLYKVLVVATWLPLIPSYSSLILDWRNCNNYILELPRFLATTLDMARILVTGASFCRQDMLAVQLFLLSFSFLYSLSFRLKSRYPQMPVIMYTTTVSIAVVLALSLFVKEYRQMTTTTATANAASW